MFYLFKLYCKSYPVTDTGIVPFRLRLIFNSISHFQDLKNISQKKGKIKLNVLFLKLTFTQHKI